MPKPKKPERANKQAPIKGQDVIFAELEAMTPDEKRRMSLRLLDWMVEEGLVP